MSETPTQGFTDADRQILDKLLKDPINIPADFKGWLQQFANLYGMPDIHELAGFRTRRWRVASVPTFETLDNTPLSPHNIETDLATDGPTLTGLEDGTYAVGAGFFTINGAANTRGGRVWFNGAAGPVFLPSVTIQGQTVGFQMKALKIGGNNTMKLRYFNATDNTSADFGLRWLAAVRVS